MRAAYFLRSGRNRSRGSPAWGEGAHRPIRPHPSGTPSAKKTKGSSAALLSASHRTGPGASTSVPGSIPMKREGRRTNQSVCPPAITPFPPVIPGTSPPSRNHIPPGIHAAQPVPQPFRPQSRAMPQAQPVNLLETGKSQPAKFHAPPRLRSSSSPVKNSHAGVAAQRGNPCFAKRSKPRFLLGATIMRRGCSATGAAGPIPRERTGAASSTARRSAVPGWICSTERVAVSLNSCLTK